MRIAKCVFNFLTKETYVHSSKENIKLNIKLNYFI